MVLSNKKQKQKLRAAKAELLAAFPEKAADLNLKSSDSLSILKGEESQKTSLSKREKLRQKAPMEKLNVIKVKEVSADAEKTNGDELKSDALEVKKKKKRKRDDSNVTDSVKEKAEPVNKKKKKTKKKKKAKKNVEKEQVKKGGEQNGSEPIKGDNLVAMSDANSKRTEDAVEAVPDKVYVGGIPYYSTEEDIISYFEQCGTITDIDCMTFPDTGKFRGIAILSFKTEAAAKRALALDGSDMGGLFLKIQPFKSSKVNKTANFAPTVLEGYNRIYIGNLSWDITEDDLKSLFSDCTISSIRFGEDKETGEFKGYAHVDFADSISLNTALKLDQTVVCGRPVKISCAVPKKGNISDFKSKPKENQFDAAKFSKEPETTQKENQVDSFKVSEEPKTMQKKNQLDSFKVIVVPTAMQKEKFDSFKVSEEPKTMQKENQFNSFKVSEGPKSMQKDYYRLESVKVSSAVSKNQVNDSSVNPVSSSKIRRRTCYECGEKGHLSSACPKKLAADVTNTGAV